MKYFLIFIIMLSSALSQAQEKLDLLVGTYTKPGKSEGIYVYSFDKGKATLKGKATGVENPSYLVLSEDGKFVYAVNELTHGKGAVSAFSYDAVTGELFFLNKLPSHGGAPCHVVCDSQQRYVVVSNYAGGSLSVFELKDDGSLKNEVQHIQYTGSGPNKARQKSPHIHSATFSPDERYLLVQDLGTDKIHVFAFDPENTKVPFKEVNSLSVTSGGGPRHLTFSENGKFVYVVEEMGSRVDVLAFDDGRLDIIQKYSLLTEKFNGDTGAADIHLSSDGKFLYASNRGDANDISIFKVSRNGKLKFAGRQSVLGKGPRNFTLSPDGKFLLVANQYSDEVVVFERNAKDGSLRDSGERILVGSPVCLVFAHSAKSIAQSDRLE